MCMANCCVGESPGAATPVAATPGLARREPQARVPSAMYTPTPTPERHESTAGAVGYRLARRVAAAEGEAAPEK